MEQIGYAPRHEGGHGVITLEQFRGFVFLVEPPVGPYYKIVRADVFDVYDDIVPFFSFIDDEMFYAVFKGIKLEDGTIEEYGQ